jgi:hypothetical protein
MADVIFAPVSKQCPQGPPFREFFPPQCCSCGFEFFETEEPFLNKPQTAKDILKRGRAQVALIPGVLRSFDVLTFK